ncbi:hypothetical protein HJFPF1_00863 [Paramyrothecium foliicola]|nr:hypothetical protein HJFPF1_00863 [Paramyrothecium foliicola]
MVKKESVPDAWEDDWEAQIDRAAGQEEPQPPPQAPVSKAERLAQHVEANRKLWQSAETPQTFHYLEANSNVPLATNFKPQVKVLSRKPMVAKRDPTTGMSQLTLDGDDGEDEAKKEVQLTPEEIRAKQKRDREEKQRRYDEARAKIFGDSAPSSGASSPGTVTPPRSEGRHTPQGRGRGRGAGAAGGVGGGHRNSDARPFDSRRAPTQFGPGRELYDPNYASKPEPPLQRRGGDGDSHSRSPAPVESQAQQQAIRAPRGPDGSGRGGFGFAQRAGKES